MNDVTEVPLDIAEQLPAALQVAISAALNAGAMLREEFDRPTGPRGHGGHADIDEPVEHEIRQTLLENFPEWGFVGEETSPDILTSNFTYWAVDPNDGTVEFVKGQRGSSVSIGLIHHGKPVLGVVYAPVAPDHSGDLIYWHAGISLHRNHIPIPSVQRNLATEPAIVFASNGADRKSSTNLRLIYPYRIRSSPSIAYRLALAAVGESEVGMSIHNPTTWDIAGGHALLRSVNCVVRSEKSESIHYTSNGETIGHGRWLFGGVPEVIESIAHVHWMDIFSGPVDVTVDAYPPALARLPKGMHYRGDPEIMSRAQGCMLGQLAGDSLGSLVEFSSRSDIEKLYPNGLHTLADGGPFQLIAGQPTDDSELAILLARSIVFKNRYDESCAAEFYAWWLQSHPFDVGNTIGGVLRSSQTLTAIGLQASASNFASSESNGALMRVSPLAIYHAHTNDDQEIARAARLDCSLTHASPVCMHANAAYVIAVAECIRSGNRDAAYQKALRYAQSVHAPSVLEALQNAAHGVPVDYSRNAGWVLIALQNTFYHLLHTDSVRDAIVQTVEQGGDTDTNAAICGAMLGAVCGRDAIPLQWRRMIASCHPVAGFSHIHQPRPAQLWPCDAMQLAELVLNVGSEKSRH